MLHCQRILAMPSKRYVRRTVEFLDRAEMDALLAAPDRSTWVGRRDHVILIVALQTGLRASELISLRRCDIVSGTGAHIRCEGKGRKQRAVPLTELTKRVLAVWLAERAGRPQDPLFPTRTGRRLSRDAIEQRVATHAAAAAERCPSLLAKKLHPHVLRHSCAMSLLQGRVDRAVMALWLGHADIRSTDAYVHADLTIKQRALAATMPASVRPGRYQPPDTLLAFLESL